MKFNRIAEALGQFLHGASIRMPALVTMKETARMERLFFLAVYGDYLGIPIMRPYYSLRLLPYIVPRIHPWMRSLLRERDLTDMAGD
ncbi:MAG: hypothetical protein V2B18_01730 [Pseudomonadota bacterium]